MNHISSYLKYICLLFVLLSTYNSEAKNAALKKISLNNTSTQRIKKNQTLYFPDIHEIAFSEFPYVLEGRASSGLSVLYQIVSGPAFITQDGILIGIRVGEIVLRIYQEGNYEYLPVSITRTIHIVKSTQSIEFDFISDKTYGDASFELKAKSSSGVPVEFHLTSDSPARINGDILTITGSGNVEIIAKLPETDKYQSYSVINTFKVFKAEQTVNFDLIRDKIFGDPDFRIYARSTKNLPVVFEILSGNAILINDMIRITGAGEVVVKAKQSGDDKYKSVEVINRFNVEKSSQNIVFTKIEPKVFGCDNFRFQAFSSSGLDLVYEIERGNVKFVNPDVLEVFGAGLVVIRAIQRGDNNYKAVSDLHYFMISKQKQVIHFPNIYEAEYDAKIKLNATVNSSLPLTYEIISGPAVLNDNLLTTTGVGVVQLCISQDGDANYLPVSVTRNFAVLKKNQVISCMLRNMTYTPKPISLNASVDTGLPISVGIIEGDCEIKNGQLLIKDTGMFRLNIYQEGNDIYRYVSKQVEFVVFRADQTLNIINLHELLIDQKYNLEATSSVGMDVDVEIMSGDAKLNGMYITPLSMGNIQVKLTQKGDSKYNRAELVKIFNAVTITGIDDLPDLDVNIYPNPASDFLHINIPDNNNYRVDIIDMNGVVVKFLNINTSKDIDVRDLPKGMYILRALSANNNFILKFVLSK